MKAGRKGNLFVGTCERCGCHSEQMLTVLFFDKRIYETVRQLRNYCPGCRQATKRNWRWPEPMSNDLENEKALRAQDQVNK